MANSVLFNRFCGTIDKWQQNINQHKWDNSIVFGYVWNSSVWEYKIYAGNVYSPATDTTINFIYDVPSKELMSTIRSSINNIENLINIDGSTFTNTEFIEAVKNVTNNRINIIENSIQWVITD